MVVSQRRNNVEEWAYVMPTAAKKKNLNICFSNSRHSPAELNDIK